MAQIRGAFTVMSLVGVTWIFGLLAMGKFRLLFQFLFCVLNSLQGFIIFTVRVVEFPDARDAWIQLLKTGTLKKHRTNGQRLAYSDSWKTTSNASCDRRSSSIARKTSADSGNTVGTSTSVGSAKDRLIQRIENNWTIFESDEPRRQPELKNDYGRSNSSKNVNETLSLVEDNCLIRDFGYQKSKSLEEKRTSLG